MIVLDASALTKLVIEEEGSIKTRNWMTSYLRNGQIVASPDIALAEVLNAIWRHFVLLKDINRNQANGAVEKLLFIWDKITKLNTEMLVKVAIGIAVSTNLTAYDSLYLAASKLNNAPLFTFDERMKEKADTLDIKTL